MMRNFFKPANSNEHDDFGPETVEGEDLDGTAEHSKAMEYESDTSNDELSDSEEDEEERWEDEWSEEGEPSQVPGGEEISEREDQPQRKRQKLDVPVLIACRKAREIKQKILEGGLKEIEKHIRSRKTKFQGGSRGLQSYRAQAIKCYLRLVVRNSYKGIPASKAAAEAFGFARKWGGRQVRRWV